MRALGAGAAYFGVVFALGFALGVARTLGLEARGVPRLYAVCIELPVMLAASWLCCAWLVRAMAVPGSIAARAAMGASAFSLLMLAEFGMALALGAAPAQHWASFREPSRALGLAGQLAFAAFPLLQARRRPTRAALGGS